MITFFLQLVIPLGLMFYRFPKRKYFVLRVVLFGVLFFGITALWYSPTAVPFIKPPVCYFVYYGVGYVLASLYVFACFKMPTFNMLFFIVVAFILQNFAHHVFELIMRIAEVPLNEEYNNVGFLFLLGGVYAVIYSLIFLVYFRRIRPERLFDMPKVLTLAVAIAFFLVMIVLGVYIKHIRTDLLGEPFIGIWYEMYSVILAAFLIFMQSGVFNNSRLRVSEEELRQCLEHEAKYYDIAKENIELINRKCHDLKYQIAALTSMNDERERRQSIAELKNAVMLYDAIAKTGSTALDCILTEKGMYCQKNNITLSVIADGKCLEGMRHSDIYALFGNAIDNAIESVMQLEDSSKSVIGLRVDERGGLVCVHIENYIETKPEFRNGLPVTTKTGEGHGFGMKSIKYITEKYNANLTVSAVNNLFRIDILMPPPTGEK